MTWKHPFSTRRGRKLRDAKLTSVNYLCEPSRHQGRLVEAVEVHHVVPLEDDGDPSPTLNGLEALCSDHHHERSHGKPKVRVDPATGLPLGDHWLNQ